LRNAPFAGGERKIQEAGMARRQKRDGNKEPPSPQLRIAVRFNDRVARVPEKVAGLENFFTGAGRSGAELPLIPLIESTAAKDLVDRARVRDTAHAPADFSKWCQVVTPPGIDPDELARALRALPDVQTAYVMRPGPPPVNPGQNPLSGSQGYLDAAPNGIDALYVWSANLPGSDGAGIGIIDVEQGWDLNHVDLVSANVTLISGINNAYQFHGTSVLGEMLMVDNTIGGVGIAPSSAGRVVSQQRTSASYNTPDAILDAAAHLSFGDIMIIEAQEYDPVSGTYYWPVEIADATYDAIRLATALGIVVVEAGCNGSYDLDSYANASGQQIFNRNASGFRDSGAIMVGAGSSASPHTRLSFSNYGTRMDCYGWGENITTTTTSNTSATGPDNNSYTMSFNGTSGATPIVTGAAAVVQGMAQASLGYRLSPLELRRILTENGTASATPVTDLIGVMPNLRAVVSNNALNLLPDLYIRDYVGDTGGPTSGTNCASPDIILQNVAVADPQSSFGAGSGTENNPSLSQDVLDGQDNYIYVRLLNRGGAVANNVSIDVYWSPPATLVTPNLWTHIGATTLAALPTGNQLTVANVLTWPSSAIPGPGHYCFVAVAGNAQDPKPNLSAFSTFAQYVDFVDNNNNVAWRNFNVLPPPPSVGKSTGVYKLPFTISGAFDTGHEFQLEAIGGLPEGSRAFIDMPASFGQALRSVPTELMSDSKGRLARLQLNPFGIQRLGTVLLHARSAVQCELVLDVPQRDRRNSYTFAIRQIYSGAEVGRITWQLDGVEKRAAKAKR
jgi:serine protease